MENDDKTLFTVRCLSDFKFFVERVIGDEFPNFVNACISALANPKTRELALVWPRGHSKTTTISINFALWYLFKENGFKIAITSSSMTQSQRILEEIQLKISNNAFLRTLEPGNKETTWNKTEMITTNGNYVFAKPFNDTARGEHVDLLICDDILRAEGITQGQIKDYFWGVFYPYTQTRKGRTIVVGTPFTTDDLFVELKAKNWFVLKYQAVIMDDAGNWIGTLWPTRFTIEDLRKTMEMMGGLIFAREYLCNPLAGGSKIFPAELIKRQIKSFELNAPLDNESYYLGMDIALSAEKSADFTVFTIIGRDDKGMFWVRKLERYKGMPTENIIKRVTELNRVFGFRKIIVESKGIGKGLAMDMVNISMTPETAAITEEFETSKKNKEAMIGQLQGQLTAENLFLTNNEILISELMAFDKVVDERSGKESYEGVGTHDDTVISLGLAMYGASQIIGDYSIEFV